MKIQLVTQIQAPDGAHERRPPVTIMETPALRAEAEAALTLLVGQLGVIVAIPPAAHEANMRLVLARDLAARGIAPGKSSDAELLTLTVVRSREAAGQSGAEVHVLRYELA